MQIYQLRPDLRHFHLLATRVEQDVDFFHQVDGRSLTNTWQTVEVVPADVPPDRAVLADYTLLGTIPVFSVEALERLVGLLRPNGEALPIRCREREYVAFNVTRVVEALDEVNSELTRFSSSGRVMSIERYAFDESLLIDLSIFKIPQLRRAFVYVTQRFVDAVVAADLSGFVFRPLPRSDVG